MSSRGPFCFNRILFDSKGPFCFLMNYFSFLVVWALFGFESSFTVGVTKPRCFPSKTVSIFRCPSWLSGSEALDPSPEQLIYRPLPENAPYTHVCLRKPALCQKGPSHLMPKLAFFRLALEALYRAELTFGDHAGD